MDCTGRGVRCLAVYGCERVLNRGDVMVSYPGYNRVRMKSSEILWSLYVISLQDIEIPTYKITTKKI